MTDEKNETNASQAEVKVDKLQEQTDAEKAYRSIAALIGQCQNIEDMVKLMTNQQVIFCGAMHFAVANPKMTSSRAKANYMLRTMYNNAKSVLENMDEEEFKQVSMQENFMRGADNATN